MTETTGDVATVPRSTRRRHGPLTRRLTVGDRHSAPVATPTPDAFIRPTVPG